MSQTSSDRSDFLIPMRWPHAGGDLVRPNHIHQLPFALLAAPTAAETPMHSPDLSSAQTSWWPRVGVSRPIDRGPEITSP
jgi:hypothetical protein